MGIAFCLDTTGVQKPVFSECDVNLDSDVESKPGEHQKSLASSSVRKKSDITKRRPDIDNEQKPSYEECSDEEKQQKTREAKPNGEPTACDVEVLEHRKEFGDFVFLCTEFIPHKEKEESREICTSREICAPLAVSFLPDDDLLSVPLWLNPDDLNALNEMDIVEAQPIPDLHIEEIASPFKLSDNKPNLFHIDSNWSDEQVVNELKEMRQHYSMLRRLSKGEDNLAPSANREIGFGRGEHGGDLKGRRQANMKLKEIKSF